MERHPVYWQHLAHHIFHKPQGMPKEDRVGIDSNQGVGIAGCTTVEEMPVFLRGFQVK